MVRALTELTDHERVQALARFQVLRPFLEEDTALTDLARQHAYPLRTLRRWVQRYRTAGLAGLVRTPRRDRSTRRRLPLVLHQCVEGLALQTPPLSIALIHRQISALARQHNLTPPSYSLVYNIVRQLPSALTTLAHQGAKAYNQRFDLLHRREAETPNEIWQADHCLLDILLVREGQAPAKPWLTVILDDYSRAMAGYPSSASSNRWSRGPRPRETPAALRYPILHRLARRRSAVPRLAARCGGRRPPRAGGAAGAARGERLPAQAGSGEGEAKMPLVFPSRRCLTSGWLTLVCGSMTSTARRQSSSTAGPLSLWSLLLSARYPCRLYSRA